MLQYPKTDMDSTRRVSTTDHPSPGIEKAWGPLLKCRETREMFDEIFGDRP